jgi:hypothetical protein
MGEGESPSIGVTSKREEQEKKYSSFFCQKFPALSVQSTSSVQIEVAII